MTQEDVIEADSVFYNQNIGLGPVRTTSAVLVKYLNPIMSNKNARLRGSKPKSAKPKPMQVSKQHVARSDVPASYGFTVRATAPKVVRTASGATITGSDYAGSVNSFNTSAYEPACSIPMNPSYYQSAMLGNLSRVYEKFRFKKATIEYIPSVPTSTQGQLVILSDRSIKNPFLDGSGSSFLGRALSQANAVACPLWQRTMFECEVKDDWSLVDPLIDGDLDDTISAEVQLYSFGTATLTTGIVILHYVIEFKDPLYTYHPTVVPVPIGIGSVITLTDDTAVNATTDTIRLGSSSLSLTLGSGSIYRLVFQQKASTLPTGPATWTAVATVLVTGAATTTTTAPASTNIAMLPGTTLYGLLVGSTVMLYSTYDTAVAGSMNGQLCYQTATTAVGTWQFLATGVRLGSPLMVTNQ